VLGPPVAFRLPRDRDAYAAIRGFVYQVDLTILRWIELANDHVLELEHGEDIDHVLQALGGAPGGLDRLLEQVKFRSAPISLRTSVAVEAIANAAEHLSSNPGLRLGFRFFTTAKVTREQHHPDPVSDSGIHVWEAVRRGDIAGRYREEAISVVRGILRTATKPSVLPDSTWRCLQNVLVATDDRLSQLIVAFEWSTAQRDSATLADSVTTALASGGLAASKEAAELLYHQLFVRAFRVLVGSVPRPVEIEVAVLSPRSA
jgi:hypothetical protein